MAAPSVSPNAARAGVLDRPVAKPQQSPAGYLSTCEMQQIRRLLRRARLVFANLFSRWARCFPPAKGSRGATKTKRSFQLSARTPWDIQQLKNRIMKRKYRNKRRWSPYQRFSFEALTILLAHAKAGSEDELLLHQELSLRKKEPKQDPRQSLLFAGSEWERTRSPWCLQ